MIICTDPDKKLFTKYYICANPYAMYTLYVITLVQYHNLSVTSHINCIAAPCLIHSMCLYQAMMTLHFLNNVAYDAESTQQSIITS